MCKLNTRIIIVYILRKNTYFEITVSGRVRLEMLVNGNIIDDWKRFEMGKDGPSWPQYFRQIFPDAGP